LCHLFHLWLERLIVVGFSVSFVQLKNTLAEAQAEERGAVLDPVVRGDQAEKGEEDNASEGHDIGGGPADVAQSLSKLRQFRHFYMVVVGYIYFTRLGVFLVDSTVRLISESTIVQPLYSLLFVVMFSCHLTWLGWLQRARRQRHWYFISCQDTTSFRYVLCNQYGHR